ncbi:hypothetical protein ACK8P5_26380 (plasmid) [Paenibacillus sp. EC2-1]|uniref:hypothetical protein n=1 Tax=Paenibacillus sp. EC2-1 TaxID=3388665 RepID=UPI003BEEB3A7
MSKVKINQTMDRRRDYKSPTESDRICPYFKERFFQWGDVDKVACCELADSNLAKCDYRHNLDDGTKICARYDYFPKFEIIEDGEADTGLDPIPYIESEKLIYQKIDQATGLGLYLDTTVDPAIETTTSSGVDHLGNVVTFDPVMIEEYPKRQWFSKAYVDTHQKVWGINDRTLGWHHGI